MLREALVAPSSPSLSGTYTQAPRTWGFWEVCQLRETPFPSVWVQAQRDPRPVECPRSRHHHLWKISILLLRTPVQGITISERSQFSYYVRPLLLFIRWKLEGFNWTEIAPSRDCAPVLRDLEIVYWCRAISRVAGNFGIQIPRLRGTYIHVTVLWMKRVALYIHVCPCFYLTNASSSCLELSETIEQHFSLL